MPRFKIETSLFEPVTIEVEGGRTYESVPLSPLLIREISKVDEQRKAGTLENVAAVVQQIALIFGIDPKEVETIDVRLLNRILEHVTAVMLGAKAGNVPDEVTAEKNAPTPGSEPTL